MRRVLLLLGLVAPLYVESISKATETSVVSGESDIQSIIISRLKERIADAKKRVVAISKLGGSIASATLQASFKKSSKIALLTEDKNGFVFAFGYTGAGDLDTPFSGFDASLVFHPKAWGDAARGALRSLGLENVMTFSPFQEFLLKVAILFGDLSQKKISRSEYFWQLNFLLYRLSHISSITTISKGIADIAPPIRALFSRVTLQGRSVLTTLDDYYALFVALARRPFSKTFAQESLVANPAYKPNGSKLSDSQARGILLALGMRAALYYEKLKRAYRATSAGKDAMRRVRLAYQQARQVHDSQKQRVIKKRAVSAFNASMPGYRDLQEFVVIELARLFGRLENPAYRSLLARFIDPVLRKLGLRLHLVLDMVDDAAPKISPPAIEEPEPDMGDYDVDELSPDSF